MSSPGVDRQRGRVVVVGAGPAGLMAADVVSAAGRPVTILERMPTAGRKLMLAGRGGLNITHSEPLDAFLARYGAARPWVEQMLSALPPAELIRFVEGLGQETFVGSSGRVFPKAMKASPLLRAWLARLAARGVELRTRHPWTGVAPSGDVTFEGPAGATETLPAAAVVLALGGASWPRLGADGSWQAILAGWGVGIAPLTASNAGARVSWSPAFATRFAGTPLKRLRVTVENRSAVGELMVTRAGLEGGAVYALSSVIGASVLANGSARLEIDLRRDLDEAALARRLSVPRGKQSMANWLRKAAKLPPVAIALLREVHGAALPPEPASLAHAIKCLPLTVAGLADLDRAISTAGGVHLDEVDHHLMLRKRPGIFVAGEMLDWDAPTGGYLLQATMASGLVAGRGVLDFLEGNSLLTSADNAG